jgi:hypothetical protein
MTRIGSQAQKETLRSSFPVSTWNCSSFRPQGWAQTPDGRSARQTASFPPAETPPQDAQLQWAGGIQSPVYSFLHSIFLARHHNAQFTHHISNSPFRLSLPTPCTRLPHVQWDVTHLSGPSPSSVCTVSSQERPLLSDLDDDWTHIIEQWLIPNSESHSPGPDPSSAVLSGAVTDPLLSTAL